MDDQSEDEDNQPIAALAKKTKAAGSRTRDVGVLLNQRNPVIHNTPKLPSSSSRPPAETNVLPRPPASHLQPNPFGYHLPHYLTPFWIPRHPGFPFPGVPLTPIPLSEANRQIESMSSSEKYHHQATRFCYPTIYHGTLGPWDPSYWRAQVPQQHPQHAYNVPGVHGFSPLQTSTVPNKSGSLGPGSDSKRGVIMPNAKLSRKHQCMWEAQSAENVQLWTIVGQLQSEIADNKSRIVKLEAEVSSLKQAAKEKSEPAMKSPPSGQPLKRSGLKRSFDSDDALESSTEEPPIARGQEHSQRKAQNKGPAIVFNEVSPDNQEESSNPPPINQLEDRKVPYTDTHNSGEVDGKIVVMPSLKYQFGPEHFQMAATRVETPSEIKSIGNERGDVIVHYDLDVLSQHLDVVNDDIGNQVTTAAEGICRTQ